MRLEATHLVDLKKRKPVAPQPPVLMPKKKRQEQRVFMPRKKWEGLTEIARFQQEAFDLIGEEQSVSRNDVVEGFLTWAMKAFWADKSGRPASDKEWNEKVKRFSEYLKKRQEEAELEDEDE